MTSDNKHPQKAKRGRRLWLFAPLILTLLVVVFIGASWQWRLVLSERFLPGVVRSTGLELVGVSVDRLDFAGAELSQLRFGQSGSQRIAIAKLSWTLSDLRARRLRSIEISGADLQIAIDRDGKFALNGLLPTGKTGRPKGRLVLPADLPFERVDITQSRISVILPDGEASIAIEGHLEALPEMLVGEFTTQYSAETKRGRGTGVGSASVSWAENSAPAGNFSLAFDRIVTANVTGTNIRLSGGTDGLPTRLEDISFRAEGFAEMFEAPQLTVHDVQLAADLSAGILELQGNGNILDWIVALSARLQPFDLTEPATLAIKASGDAADIAQRLAQMSALGDAAITIDTKINNPAELFAARDTIAQNPAMAASHVSGELKLQADLQQFALADVLQTGDVSANVSARWSGSVLDLDFGRGTHFDNVTVAPALERKITPWVPRAAPFDLVLTDGTGSPPRLRLSWTDGPIEVNAIGGAKLVLPEGAIELAVDGTATGSLGTGIDRFDVKTLHVKLASVPAKFGSVSGDILATNLSGGAENLAGTAVGELSVSDASMGTISARRMVANFDGGLELTPDKVSVVLSSGDRVTGQNVRLNGDNSVPGTSRIQLADGSHRLTINRHDGALSLDFSLRPGAVKLRSTASRLAVTHGAVDISGTWPGVLNIEAQKVTTDAGSGRRVDLSGLRARMEGDSSDTVVAITLEDVDPTLPNLTLPTFDATAKIIRKGPSFVGELDIVAAGGQPNLRARGQHSLKTGKGEGEILEAHLRFAPGVLQPEDLNPAIAGMMENVFATITLAGPIKWEKAGALSPNLTLVIDDLAVSTKNLELFDAQTSIVVTGLPELETPPGQQFSGQVRVGRLDPVPVDVSFQFLPGQSGLGPRLIIENLLAELDEGRLTTNRFVLVPPSTDTDLTLRIEGADLARAFEVIGVAGIGGTGRISGDIPVTVRGNQLAISGGSLANDGPGEVFFDIAALPQNLIDRDDTVTLVLQALSNFSYNELKIDIDKALDGPGTLRTRLTGANPDVLENHPFVFNINLESNFDRLAALVLEGLTTSQGLLRALALSPSNDTDSVAQP